jgi:hypothetical protein
LEDREVVLRGGEVVVPDDPCSDVDGQAAGDRIGGEHPAEVVRGVARRCPGGVDDAVSQSLTSYMKSPVCPPEATLHPAAFEVGNLGVPLQPFSLENAEGLADVMLVRVSHDTPRCRRTARLLLTWGHPRRL